MNCLVCGARLKYLNHTFCDPVCRRAQDNGRSRYAQLTVAAKEKPYPEKRNDSRDMDAPFHVGGQ